MRTCGIDAENDRFLKTAVFPHVTLDVEPPLNRPQPWNTTGCDPRVTLTTLGPTLTLGGSGYNPKWAGLGRVRSGPNWVLEKFK
jgi:hypothetical protein